jgi:hypothetical protein
MLRESCIDCTRKHIGSAIVLFTESMLGYPEHFWIAIGHLGQAEEESIKDFPELAKMIRKIRREIMDKKNFCNIDWIRLIKETKKYDHN